MPFSTRRAEDVAPYHSRPVTVGRDLRARRSNERKTQMAAKTKAIEVKVDERLAEAISDKAVKAWHATNYSNGRKRVYVTFEEVVSA